MKKVVLITIVFIITLVLVQTVYALEKTKMFGMTEANKQVALVLSYTRNGEQIDEQKIVKESNNIGYWSLTMNTDPGTIDLKVSCAGESKDFEVPVGGEFSADLIEQEETEEQEEETEEQEEETEEQEEETEEQESSSITGKSIFSLDGENKNFSTIYLGIILFLIVILGNLASTAMVGLSKRIIGNKKDKKELEQIRITKLSEKLNKLKEQEGKISEEIGKVREE